MKRTRENSRIFPREVVFITVGVLPTQKESFWKPVHAGWVLEVESDFIQHVIDGKNGKVELYKRQCEEVWLLLVAGNNRASSSIELAVDAQRNIYLTNFNRVFFYSYFDNQYNELLTNP